jgi:hypothetical protein
MEAKEIRVVSVAVWKTWTFTCHILMSPAPSVYKVAPKNEVVGSNESWLTLSVPSEMDQVRSERGK